MKIIMHDTNFSEILSQQLLVSGQGTLKSLLVSTRVRVIKESVDKYVSLLRDLTQNLTSPFSWYCVKTNKKKKLLQYLR